MWKLGKLKIPRTTVTQPGEITNSEYIATENLDTNLYNDNNTYWNTPIPIFTMITILTGTHPHQSLQ